MKTIKERTAKERYDLYKRLIFFYLFCIAIFAGITIYDLVTGSPISASTSLYVSIIATFLCLTSVNMNNAADEMKKETEGTEAESNIDNE